MISITVQRQPGDKPGPEITDALITSEVAAVERSRVEIDKACSHRQSHALTGPHRSMIWPGALVEVHGPRQTWRGLVKRCAITIARDGDNFSAERHLEIERQL